MRKRKSPNRLIYKLSFCFSLSLTHIYSQIFHVLFRHLPQLKQIYRIYARLGVDLQNNIDNTFLMNRMQFWRFLLDCNLHGYGVTLMEYDRWIGEFVDCFFFVFRICFSIQRNVFQKKISMHRMNRFSFVNFSMRSLSSVFIYID